MARVRLAARASLLAAVLGILPFSAQAAGSEAKPVEAGKPPPESKAKPNEPKSVEAKPAEGKPRASKPEKAKPVAKASEPKPVEAKSADAKALEPRTQDGKSGDAKSGDAKSNDPKASVTPDPQRGVGTRSVGALPNAASSSSPSESSTESAKPLKNEKAEKLDKTDKQARASHQKGKPPHRPSGTLPAGAARSAPDRGARQKIADGPT